MTSAGGVSIGAVVVGLSRFRDGVIPQVLRRIHSTGMAAVGVRVVPGGSHLLEYREEGGIDVIVAPNMGYGSAANLGARHLPSTEWLLVLNDDVTLSPATLTELEGDLRTLPSDVTVVGTNVLSADGSVTRSRAPIPSRRVLIDILIGGERRALLGSEGHYPKGAVIALRRDSFLSLKGFDTDYFLYFEEVDLFLRAREAGERTVFLTLRDPPVHAGGATSSRHPWLTSDALGASTVLFCKKHGHLLGRGALLLYLLVYGSALLRGVVRGDLQAAIRFSGALCGMVRAVARRPMLAERRGFCVARPERARLAASSYGGG